MTYYKGAKRFDEVLSEVQLLSTHAGAGRLFAMR
jgi:hypothetical protein